MERHSPSTPSSATVNLTAKTATLAACALVLGLLLAPPAQAQAELYNFSVGLLGTVGGSQDVEPGDEFDNTGFQLDLGMVTEPGEHLFVRLGQLGLDSADQFGTLTDADMLYVTVGGEYRFRHSFYDSGLFLALGGYRLEGNDVTSRQSRDETSLGLSMGASGEFPINPNLGVQLELSGHYVDFDEAQIFVMAGVGLIVHF